MEAYLDNAATTKVSDVVLEKMNQVYCLDFGNPSSMHKKGMEAEQYIMDLLVKEGKQAIVFLAENVRKDVRKKLRLENI